MLYGVRYLKITRLLQNARQPGHRGSCVRYLLWHTLSESAAQANEDIRVRPKRTLLGTVLVIRLSKTVFNVLIRAMAVRAFLRPKIQGFLVYTSLFAVLVYLYTGTRFQECSRRDLSLKLHERAFGKVSQRTRVDLLRHYVGLLVHW